MEWEDSGIVVSVRAHSENAAIVHLLTQEHGLCAGYVKGAQSNRGRSLLQLGNLVQARWVSRTEDALGTFILELEGAPGLATWHDPKKMLSLQSACAIIHKTMPERECFPGIYEGLLAYLDMLDSDLWPQGYIVWEVNLLRALGFGIDFSRCALTGQSDNLKYVSPRTGKAVTQEGAGELASKLLVLPAFLTGLGVGNTEDIVNGLKMTGYFLEKHVFNAVNQPIPDVRIKLYDAFIPEKVHVL